MSYDINTVTLCGRLTKDPEVSRTKNGTSLAKFSLAVGEGKDETSFFDVTAWKTTAESVGKYCFKGSQVVINGKLKQDRWEKEGQNRSKVIINAFQVQFVGAKSERTHETQEMPNTFSTPAQGFNGNPLTGQEAGSPF